MAVTKLNAVDYAVTYGEFMYKAASWRHERRVIFKIEKPTNQFTFMYTFVVTNMELETYQVISYYCNRDVWKTLSESARTASISLFLISWFVSELLLCTVTRLLRLVSSVPDGFRMVRAIRTIILYRFIYICVP